MSEFREQLLRRLVNKITLSNALHLSGKDVLFAPVQGRPWGVERRPG